MKKITFEGRDFLVEDNVRYITQDPQGTICAHVNKSKQVEYDFGCPIWKSDGVQELSFPSNICRDIMENEPKFPLGDMD